jgi:hypothetical protein
MPKSRRVVALKMGSEKVYDYVILDIWVYRGSPLELLFLASLYNCSSFKIPIFCNGNFLWSVIRSVIEAMLSAEGCVATLRLEGLLVLVSLCEEKNFLNGKMALKLSSRTSFPLAQRQSLKMCGLQRNDCYSHSRMANHECESL